MPAQTKSAKCESQIAVIGIVEVRHADEPQHA